MANPAQVCEFCQLGVNDVFDPNTGTRQSEVIAGDLLVGDQCFVRDEIRFINNGRLIFVPTNDNKEYFREYFVICRKLVIVGGNKPGSFDPCGPDDPGSTYNANNVITWQDRLTSAAPGAPPSPFTAADGVSRPSTYSNQGQGNDGQDGGDGTDGSAGGRGGAGMNAPKFTIVALEVEIGIGDHLTIDFDGQNGGQGGRGQNAGDGGSAMRGNIGESDTSWPGTGCDRQPGNGGDGGDGGDGGTGGNGGDGGRAGSIEVISTQDNVTTGPFVSGGFSYINDGGSAGVGGFGGIGGRGRNGADPGFPTSECGSGSDGTDGVDGEPAGLAAGPGSPLNQGATGTGGAGAAMNFTPITRDSCLDDLPLPVTVSSITPSVLCRGFSTAANVDIEVNGTNLLQVTNVTTNLANVAITILASSTDTVLNLRFNLASNSDIGPGDLVFERGFGDDHIENNAITVNRFEVTGVAPNTGSRNEQVAVTISGSCFDLTAAIQTISVSSIGIDVLNPIFIDENTAQCVLDIGAIAPLTARSITVQTGILSHTLIDAFTVVG